ncbi:hypothetical protein ACEYW6_22950 [Nostoc sp. UIC 10607]|uniref:Uncharacterized protein n=2 Tax=Nostoc TaxID=1177 RepID=A0ABR8IF09_9NOSO|nr:MULTISPECIES: hypothetical protein [Nostoc]MBD2563360.1 hypothetical protein [Nostoc linckia FACHB-391]MBD2649050.1 hypothetical protein [Nostoc foliaceum FACHB-393]
MFNYSATFNHALAGVNWHILALILVGDILLLLLIEDDNTTGAGGKGHIKYFDLYIYYRATDAVWLKNLLPMCFDNSVLV